MSSTAKAQNEQPFEEEISEYNTVLPQKKAQLLIRLPEYAHLPNESISSYVGKKREYLFKHALNLPIPNQEKNTTREVEDIEEMGTPILPLYEKEITKRNYFTALQKWEGTVLEIKKNYVIAKLVDLSTFESDEVAKIPFEELSKSDLDLVVPGAIFYWNIGYEDYANGERKRVSIIRFRRLPVWSEEEILQAQKRAESMLNNIKWE